MLVSPPPSFRQDQQHTPLPAVLANPYAAYAYFNRGNLLRRLGKLAEAEEDYRKSKS